MEFYVKKLNAQAILPTRSHEQAAGWDLYSTTSTTINPHGRAIVNTGIAVELPVGTVGLIRDRSGLAAKHGLTVLAGVMDSDYRGEYLVVLHNTTDAPYLVAQGDRIAQLIILQTPTITLTEKEELSTTLREEGRFGSTGR
jgi:dUTP pyrophosphatase